MSNPLCVYVMIQEKDVRLSSPTVESSTVSVSVDAASRSNEWKAVPDIWRSSAEKYGDRVALVDPYHDPPLKLTYKQVRFLTDRTFFFSSILLQRRIKRDKFLNFPLSRAQSLQKNWY